MKINRRWRPFSLATRLTFFISLATITAFLAFTWIMLHSVEKHFAEQDINDLTEISVALDNILLRPNISESQKAEQIQDVLASYRSIAVLIRNQDGDTLYHSANGPDLMPVLQSPRIDNYLHSGEVFVWPAGGHTDNRPDGMKMHHTTYRMMASAVNSQSIPRYTVLVALSINFHLHYLDELKSNLMLIAALISLAIVLIVLMAVRKGHQPLRSVSMKIQNISSENLDMRLDPNAVPIELRQLVISFNHMIERIEDVFNRQANFSADIAHEIRTPITNLVTQTEIVLSKKRSEKELEDVLYSNLEEYNRMAKMVSDMLFLAQADNNQLIPERVPLDLRAETIKVFEFFEAWAEEQGVGLTFKGGSSVIEGDPLMIRRVIYNLLSNAIRYTPRGQSVTIHVNDRDDKAELIVENPGSPIPAEHLPRILDRFYRIDPSRQRKGEGSGIGLAIVKSIVTAHQGKISVTSDTVSTRFTVLLTRLRPR